MLHRNSPCKHTDTPIQILKVKDTDTDTDTDTNTDTETEIHAWSLFMTTRRSSNLVYKIHVSRTHVNFHRGMG
jgi:hypothetical protein